MRIYKNGVYISLIAGVLSLLFAICSHFYNFKFISNISIGVFSSAILTFSTSLGAYFKKRSEVFNSLREGLCKFLEEFNEFVFIYFEFDENGNIYYEWKKLKEVIYYNKDCFLSAEKITSTYENFILNEDYSCFFNSKTNKLIMSSICLAAKINSAFQYMQFAYKHVSLYKLDVNEENSLYSEKELKKHLNVISLKDDDTYFELAHNLLLFNWIAPVQTIYNTNWKEKYKI